MKLCLFGINGIPLGRHNIKDARLDTAHELVEAKKKVYVQAELLDAKGLAEAEAVLTDEAHAPDLILKDLELVETRRTRATEAAELAALTKLQEALESGAFVRTAGLTAEERRALAAHSFTTDKPVIVAQDGEWQDALDTLLVRAYAEAGYISFLTVGGKENRAWKIRRGATAWEAAGVIHTDIQRGFIRAEVISFADFVEAGGETQAKRAGKQRLETKSYVMQDFDVVNFRFNK